MRSFRDESGDVACRTLSLSLSLLRPQLGETAPLSAHYSDRIPFPQREGLFSAAGASRRAKRAFDVPFLTLDLQLRSLDLQETMRSFKIHCPVLNMRNRPTESQQRFDMDTTPVDI